MGKIGIPRFIKPADSFINKLAGAKKTFHYAFTHTILSQKIHKNM